MNFLKKVENRIEQVSRKKEFMIVTLISLLVVFGVTIIMGTLTSGFHLVDDHDFTEFYYDLNYLGKDLWDVLVEGFKRGFTNRYIPLYYPVRILTTYFLGIDMVAHSVLKALEIVVSMLLLYYCARMMKCKVIYSYFFVLVSFIGYQSVLWWKLGPQEAQCTLLLASGMFFSMKWLESEKKRWAIISLICYGLMANYKESFIAMMPFAGAFVLYLDVCKSMEKMSIKFVWNTICKRKIFYIFLLIFFLVPAYILVFKVGTTGYGSFGDPNVSLGTYIDVFFRSARGDLKWFARFGVLFIAILLTFYEGLKKMWKEILLVFVFLAPQFILYGQTGIEERYMLPTTIGYSLFFVLFVSKENLLVGKRRLIYILGVLLMLCAHGRAMLREADYFRYRGESVNTMLNSVLEMSNAEHQILTCFYPNIEGNSTVHYWMLDHDVNHELLFYWFEEEQIISKEYDENDVDSPKKSLEEQYSFEDIDIVVMYNKEDRHWEWCRNPEFDLTDFTKIVCGTLDIYVRDNSGIKPIDIDIAPLIINF